MMDRIVLGSGSKGPRKVEPNAATKAALGELERCWDMEEFRLLRGYVSAGPRLIHLAGRGQPRAVVTGGRR